MTKDQVDDEFKNVELEFVYYYKYQFTFKGKSDKGNEIMVSYGGSGDDIYRFELDTSKPKKFYFCDYWELVTVFDGKTTIFEYSKY